MLRRVVLALLLANALLLAAQWGWFDRLTGGAGGSPTQREPDRLQRQRQPERVQILSSEAASAALGAAAQVVAAASAAAAARCLEAGPFASADAEAVERSLREAGLAAGSWLARKSEDSGSFMVYMGRYADHEALQHKQDELKRLKLDAEELRGTPELQPGLSLGRFDNKPAADAALAGMLRHGVRTARVITLRPAQSQTSLRLPAADPATRTRLAGLRLPAGPGFVLCAAPGQAAGPALPTNLPAGLPSSAPATASAAAAPAKAPVAASAPR